MRKFVENTGTFYYPDKNMPIWDGRELKVIVENPQGYVNGDMVRIVYGIGGGTFGENIFDATSPLVDGRAIFYLPILWLHRSLIAHPTHTGVDRRREIHISIKQNRYAGTSLIASQLFRDSVLVTLDNTRLPHGRNQKLTSIPVFWYSEKGIGVFGNDKLNYNVNYTPNQLFRIRAIRDANMFNWDLSSGQASAGQIRLSGIKKVRSLGSPEKWIPCKIDDISSYVQLLWFEVGYETVLSHWFKIKEETYSRDEVGEVRQWETLMDSDTLTHYDDRQSTYKVYKPSKKVTLSSGLFPSYITDRIKKMAMSPLIWKYSPFSIVGNFKDIVHDFTNWSCVGSCNQFEKTNNVATAVINDAWGGLDCSIPIGIVDGMHVVNFKIESHSSSSYMNNFEYRIQVQKNFGSFTTVKSGTMNRGETKIIPVDMDKQEGDYFIYQILINRTYPVQSINMKLSVSADITVTTPDIDVIAQVTKLEGLASSNSRPGEWSNIPTGYYESEVIEELIYHPSSSFKVEAIGNVIGGQGYFFIDFRQHETRDWEEVLQYATTNINFNINIDKRHPINPQFRVRTSGNPNVTFDLKEFYIYGNVGGYEVANVDLRNATITKHNDDLSEFEFTLDLDEFRKPDYLIF